MKTKDSRLYLFAVLLVIGGCQPSASPADLVLRGGIVATVDDAHGQAQAVAIRGDRILDVGSDDHIAQYIGDDTDVIELNGRLLIPGFIEGHGHYMRLGQSQMILDLADVQNWDEVVSMVDHVVGDTRAGEWIIGGGWHQEKWSETPADAVEGVPVHNSLSAVTPDNPVLLFHSSGHAAFANAKAMELAGIDRNTPNPVGGEIVHDANGEPTGMLREKAQLLASDVQEEAAASRTEADQRAELVRQVQLAGQNALEHGVTSFHDAGSSFETIDFLRSMADDGALPIRLYVMIRYETNDAMAAQLPNYRMINYGNNFLTVRSIKRQIDGALGSHGAWLFDPYVDLPSTGLALESVDEIQRSAELAVQHEFQLNTHAIGDRANREVLDIYERAFANTADASALRWRIEHAQHLDPADIPRFVEMGVIAAMQGVHATSDAPWVFRRLGAERARSGAYLWRDLIDAGVVVANGTDVPVERIDPITSFYASVSRRVQDGSVFFPEQRMTREEALRSYTINNAYAAFEEDIKGSITPGKLADLAVLSQDILTVDEAEIPSTTVDLTVLGGVIVFRRDQ